MEQTFNVSFVCDYMVAITTITVMNDLTDERIARIASEYILDNYGFDPLELCYDYEVNEV